MTSKALVADAIANTTVSARLDGMMVELSRPWIVGKPPAREIELIETTLAAQEAAIEAAVAGRPVSGTHAAAQATFDDAGLSEHFSLRASHGIGIVMHDFPEDAPFEDRPLLAGEVYAIEPSLYVGGVGGFRYSDTILVGTGSPERITQSSKDRKERTLQ